GDASHERLDPQPRHDRHGDDRRVGNCFHQGAAPGFACSRQRRGQDDRAARRGRHGAGLARYVRREVPTMSARTLTELFFDAVERYADHAAAFRYKAAGACTIAALEGRGRVAAAKYPRFKEEALGVRPDDLATLIYTSGTTGQPKGVMLTHDNICSNVRGSVETLRVSEDDSCLALLPLSHILERMVDYYFFHVGVTINYAESVDAFAQNLQEIRPTVVAAVPRVYEKVYARVLENAMTGSAAKRRIFQW